MIASRHAYFSDRGDRIDRPARFFLALLLIVPSIQACVQTRGAGEDLGLPDAAAGDVRDRGPSGGDGSSIDDLLDRRDQPKRDFREDASAADLAVRADAKLAPMRCSSAKDCDHGFTCTVSSCVKGRCRYAPKGLCPWPAESAGAATNLTPIAGPLINAMHKDLSGAVYDPLSNTLWVCRNTRSDSRIWAVVPDGKGSYRIAEKAGRRAEWSNFGDLEGLTLASLRQPSTLYLMIEGAERIREVDLSLYGKAVIKNDWNTRPFLPVRGGAGSEGITFVPDAFLRAQGFVDAKGRAYVSRRGMGGLMFVGHQNGGRVYAFDLDRGAGTFDFVGAFQTAASETAGLEFDRSTGQLLIWHGASFNTLEVAQLSSGPVGKERKLDTIRVHRGPGAIFNKDNYEGIAVMPAAPCAAGRRGFFLTADGGSFWSLLWFKAFPCR